MIKDGQAANAANTNAAFISRTADSSTTGRVTLTNATDTNSGAQVTNAQRAINETFDAVGMTGEGDATRKQYSSSNYIASGDSHKVALGKLDAQAKAQTTAQVPASQVTGQLPFTQVSGTVPITQGGTGQTTQSAAFNALSPNTAKGDVAVYSGSTNSRLPVGSDAQVLTADSTQALGVKWSTVSSANPNVSNATGTLPIANGGTGSTTQNFVDLSTAQTVGGAKTLSVSPIFSALTTAGVLTNTASGQVGSTPTVAIAQGGTGQSTKTAAFNALSPSTTKGDLHGFDGTNNTRVPVGSNGQLLQSDSTNANGVSWVTTNSVSAYAIYTITTAQAVAANGIIKYANLIKDTNSGYSTTTGLFTVPTGLAGLWVTQIVTSTTGGQVNYYVKRNGTSIGYITFGNAITTGQMPYPCNAGDTLGVYIDAAATIGAAGPQGPVAQVFFWRLGQ